MRTRGARGGNHVLDADIRDYFGSIDHKKLLTLVARRVRGVSELRGCLKSEVAFPGIEAEKAAVAASRVSHYTNKHRRG